MKVLVIDGQGGGLGRQLVTAVKARYPEAEVLAVGTNSAATNAMLKAGADQAATGENSVAVACRKADAIMGPVGIVIADIRCSASINPPDGGVHRAEPGKKDTDTGQSVRQHRSGRGRSDHGKKSGERSGCVG